jgi:competence protein ComEA
MFKVILGVLFFTIVTLVAFLNLDPNIVQPPTSQLSSLSTDFMTVGISGEVQKPGTYIVKKDGILGDLITLSGGTSTNADEDAFQLTLPLFSGGQFYIAPKFDPTDVCGTSELIKVAINSANRETLMTLSNIGTSLANAIVEYRQSQGNFTYLEQIMEVPGIGQSTYTRIKNYITLL